MKLKKIMMLAILAITFSGCTFIADDCSTHAYHNRGMRETYVTGSYYYRNRVCTGLIRVPYRHRRSCDQRWIPGYAWSPDQGWTYTVVTTRD